MSKKNMKQDSKKTMVGDTDRQARINAKIREQNAADKKKLMIGGAIAIAVAAILSIVLIWHYGEPTLARVNGIRLRAGDVAPHMSAATSTVWGLGYEGDMERRVREEAARQAALIALYKDYGIGLGLTFTGEELHTTIRNTVRETIIANPAAFENFEEYMPEDLTHEAEAKALEILERARAGEDFHTLMHTYSQDPLGLAMYPDGYTFFEGMMVPEFYEGTKALEIGEISDLVPTGFGFHIIKRIEPDPESIMGGEIPPVGEDGEEAELLGAMHILIPGGPTLADRMRQAVDLRFESKLEDANIVFSRSLYNVEF